jgi:hypothetical protein
MRDESFYARRRIMHAVFVSEILAGRNRFHSPCANAKIILQNDLTTSSKDVHWVQREVLVTYFLEHP